jgi:hypothetical protein
MMAEDDYPDFDQEWFFDELKGNQDQNDSDIGTSLNVPTSPPASSTNDHGASSSQSHSQIPQQMQQSSHQSNAYQEQSMGHMDGMMPSTSNYGVQQRQPSHIQEQQQQIPVSQHQQLQQQQHQMQQQIHQQQNQPQFETLQTYNPNQPQQNIQNHYQQQNSQQMVFDMGMDFIQNEASTSTDMPMGCRISQEYSIQQYHQQPPQQHSQNENWAQMDSSSQITQQHGTNMSSVVYTSQSQQMPRIPPDPGGHHPNQPQMINNYNSQQPQQIIQTGINGETILTSMQPVQQIHQRNISQQPQQQQFEINSNNFIQQQITYIDHAGNQQFITSQPPDNNNPNFHQPIMQVIPQGIPIQPAPQQQQPEPQRPAPTPQATKTKAKNTPRSNGRKKNQTQSSGPAESGSILSQIASVSAVEVQFAGDMSMKMMELCSRMSDLESRVSFYK